LPRHWRELAPLVDRLLDAPREGRAALLTELSAGDPVRRADLERLVAECEHDMSLLDAPAVERFDQLVSDTPGTGLPDVLGGRYRIMRELGRGGMARVYLAEDLKHARNVAVKVIRPELAESLGRGRFLREIGIAARLRHPNIMPLYDSGDADGVLYFVMPHEDGPSLKTRLADGQPFTTTDAVSVLRDVARALAYAHDQGVVHRDVKPDNVMLSGGAAVVTDFGIAKAFSAAQSEAPGGTITQTGVIIGTPAYMAPEQAVGDPTTDHRADIYSFGCLAYELFVGKAPFPGASSHQIIAAQLGTTPKRVSDLRGDVPDTVVGLIARCLEKEPSARPQRAQELVDVLETAPTSAPSPALFRRQPAARKSALAIATAIVVLAGYLLVRGTFAPGDGATGQVTVTVLPFTSPGGDAEDSLMAQGFSDDLAGALVKFPCVRVISRGGAVNYLGQPDLDPQAVGKALGARYLVPGSFRNFGGNRTVQAQLVSSGDGAMLWAEHFDRPAELAVLRDEIAKAISDTLRSKAGGAACARPSAAPVARRVNNAAFEKYLVGQRKLTQRGQSLTASIEFFREAIALDTLLAEAYAGLSLALGLSPEFQRVPPGSVAVEATATARRAMQLDPKLAGPHTAFGLVLEHNHQWDEAESEFRRALELDSHDVEARVQYGRHLATRGRIVEAIAQYRSARDDDPAAASVASNLAAAWLAEGKLDSALAESSRAMRIDSVFLAGVLTRALVLVSAGRNREAHEVIERNPPYQPTTLYVLGATGDSATVRERLKALPGRRPRPGDFENATAYALLGLRDTAGALDALERASKAKELWFFGVNQRQVQAALRGNARYRALLAGVGLTEK
jgi:serine/threonine-protein kinase